MLVFADSYLAEIKGVFALGGMRDLDDISFGYEGAVASEVKSAMQTAGTGVPALNFIAGLAGRDIHRDAIRTMFEKVERAASGEEMPHMEFIDTRW